MNRQDEQLLCDLFTKIINSEKQIEEQRIRLCANFDFHLTAAFTIITNQNSISYHDIKLYQNQFAHKIEIPQYDAICRYATFGKNSTITFEEFENMILPREESSTKQRVIQTSRRAIPDNFKLSHKTSIELSYFLNNLGLNLVEINKQKTQFVRQLYLNPEQIFYVLDINSKGYINEFEIEQIFKNCNKLLHRDDLQVLLDYLNGNLLKKVNYHKKTVEFDDFIQNLFQPQDLTRNYGQNEQEIYKPKSLKQRYDDQLNDQLLEQVPIRKYQLDSEFTTNRTLAKQQNQNLKISTPNRIQNKYLKENIATISPRYDAFQKSQMNDDVNQIMTARGKQGTRVNFATEYELRPKPGQRYPITPYNRSNIETPSNRKNRQLSHDSTVRTIDVSPKAQSPYQKQVNQYTPKVDSNYYQSDHSSPRVSATYNQQNISARKGIFIPQQVDRFHDQVNQFNDQLRAFSNIPSMKQDDRIVRFSDNDQTFSPKQIYQKTPFNNIRYENDDDKYVHFQNHGDVDYYHKQKYYKTPYNKKQGVRFDESLQSTINKKLYNKTPFPRRNMQMFEQDDEDEQRAINGGPPLNRFQKDMSAVYTEIQVLKHLIINEKHIEQLKIQLAGREDFNLQQAIEIFDTDGKGYVSNLDMIEGMKDLGVPTPQREFMCLINRLDEHRTGQIKHHSIQKLFRPIHTQYQQMLAVKSPIYEFFSEETQLMISNLMKQQILNEFTLYQQLISLNTKEDLDLRNSFWILDIYDQGVLTAESLRDVFLSLNIRFEEEELLATIQKFSFNSNKPVDVIRLQSFINFLTPQY